MRDNETTFELEGYKFKGYTEQEEGQEAPWEWSDGYGPVSNWTRTYGQAWKRPGQRVLCEHHGNVRLYDWQEAIFIAKRDGWGLAPKELAELVKRLGRTPTARQVREEAVRLDFEFLRGWCNDGWTYVTVVTELCDVEGKRVGHFESLSMVESNSGDYIEECMQELARTILDTYVQGQTQIEHCTRARHTIITLKEAANA